MKHTLPASVDTATIRAVSDRSYASKKGRVPRPLVAANLVMLFVAVGFRLWQLDNVPGVNGDEAWYGVLARRIAQGNATTWWTPTGNPLNPIYVGPLILLHLAAEPSVVLLRCVSAASGILALALNFWLCRKVYGRRTAAISTLILAVLPINIAYSRFGWDASQSLLVTVPVVYLSMAAAQGGPGARLRLAAGAAAFAAAILVHPTNVFVAPFLLIAAVRLLAQQEIWVHLQAMHGTARAAFYGVLGSSAAGIAWLGRRWLLVGASRAVDPHQILEFLNRFQRLFTGATVYQFIPGSFEASALSQSRSPSLAAHDIAGLTVLAGAVILLAMHARRRPDGLDSRLLLSSGASVAAFYLIAGPEALAPHWERYSMCLVGPTALVAARSATHWLRPPGGGRRAAMLVAAGWLIVGGFYWNYFWTFTTTGGNSHQTFRTGPIEPKVAAIEHIRSHRTVDQTNWIVTSAWWNYWPLAYLASGEQGLQVLWADNAWSNPEVLAAARTGRVWVVEFAGSKEADTGRELLTTASSSPPMPDDPAVARLDETFTFDYAGRAVLSISRITPPVP